MFVTPLWRGKWRAGEALRQRQCFSLTRQVASMLMSLQQIMQGNKSCSFEMNVANMKNEHEVSVIMNPA